MISKGLSAILSYAVKEARKRRHEYVCIEHILYAIVNDSGGIELIETCGGDVESIQNELEVFFNKKLNKVPDDQEYVLQQTMQFQRVIHGPSIMRGQRKKSLFILVIFWHQSLRRKSPMHRISWRPKGLPVWMC